LVTNKHALSTVFYELFYFKFGFMMLMSHGFLIRGAHKTLNDKDHSPNHKLGVMGRN